MSIFIFFLVFLSMISPSQQTFYHGKDDHNPPNCDHFSNFTTNGYLVFRVSSKGCGVFTKVQDAIDAITPSSQVKNLILIDFGIYMERVLVPSNKMNLSNLTNIYNNHDA
ncbi:hypothetical protein HID58_017562 [Brassica napus]|uniref:Pectinesterase n=1 Tax=Brassica napus TaxID=3708 RepID=A0ABQ7X8D1_BRANA|nr:hypothetical protein HID58_090927 [Brassica napus]KAH0925306.1 hypothetical protein HID58_017562 [Brassica napus]